MSVDYTRVISVGQKEKHENAESEGETHLADRRADLGWRRDLVLAVELGDLLVVRACARLTQREAGHDMLATAHPGLAAMERNR